MNLRSGDQCPQCRIGQMRVRSSYDMAELVKQRLECKHCGHTELTAVPATSVHRRKARCG